MAELEPGEIPYSVRDKHIFIPGLAGQGKSTLFHHLAYQDIKNGHGVCVIDPKGDLVSKLVHWIPEDRIEDCIYLTLDHPVPLDLLSHRHPDERGSLVGDLKFIITKGAGTDATPVINQMLSNLVYTFFSANENPEIPPERMATFMDIHDFFDDPLRAKELLSYATPEYQRKWADKRFPNVTEQSRILSRMTDYANDKTLRTILGTSSGKIRQSGKLPLSIAECMDSGKILLVDVGGASEVKLLYATLLIAKIQQAAFGRHHIPEEKRRPFYLYIDEFRHFQNPSVASIIAEARGYKLGMTLGLQWFDQMIPEILAACMAVSSYIIFGLSPDDAPRFKSHLSILKDERGKPVYTPDDLVHMLEFHALWLINRRNPYIKKIKDPPPPPTPRQIEIARYIRKRTVDTYSCQIVKEDLPLGDHGKPSPKSEQIEGAPEHRRSDGKTKTGNKPPG